MLGGHVEIVEHLGLRCFIEIGLVDSCGHVTDPTVSLFGADSKVHMTHAKPRVALLVAIGSWAAKVLPEEQR